MSARRLALVLCVSVFPALAGQVSWTAAAPGLFTDAANWTSLGGGGHVTPGSNDTMIFSSSQAPSPAVAVVRGSFAFSVHDMSVSGLNTVFILQDGTGSINQDLFIGGVPGGDNPVGFSAVGPGTIDVGHQVQVGTRDSGVNAALSLSKGANLNTGTLSVGAVGTQGVVSISGGNLNTTTILLGFGSPLGALSVDNGTVIMRGAGGLNVGSFNGTGSLNLGPNGIVSLSAGALSLGALGAQGTLAIAGDLSFASGFLEERPAAVNAGAQDVLVGSSGGTGVVSIGPHASMNTTGTITIGTGSGTTGAVQLAGDVNILGNGLSTLNAGTLVVGDDGGTGSLQADVLSTVNAGQLIVGRAGATGVIDLKGTGRNPAALAVTGNAAIGIDGGTGTMVLEQATSRADIAGALSVGTGTTGAKGAISSAGILNAGSLQAGIGTGNTGVLQLTGGSVTTISGPALFGSANGQGTLILQDSARFNANDTSAASITFGSQGGTGTLNIASQGSLVSQGTVTFGASGGTGTGQVAGTGTLSAAALVLGSQGTGTLVLDGGGTGGTNQLSISGSTTIGSNGGTGALRAINKAGVSVHDVNLGTTTGSTGTISLESGSTLQAGAIVAGSTTSGNGSAVMIVNQATAGASTATFGRGGDLALLQVANGGQFSTTGALTIGSNGVLVVTDAGSRVNVGGAFTVSGPVAAVPLDNGNLAAVQNGGELDAGSISVGVGGKGTLVADGANSNVKSAATTTIGGSGGNGTFVLQNGGTLTSTGAVTVNTGGTLIGSGSVVGTVINNGGTVIPGGSPGLLHIFGDYSQTADGTLQFEIFGSNPSQYDRLVVDGNLDVAGTIRLIFSSFTPTAGSVFNLISFGGSGLFAGSSIEVLGLGVPVITQFSDGVFRVQVTPEPETAVFLALGIVMLPVWLRLRRQRVS